MSDSSSSLTTGPASTGTDGAGAELLATLAPLLREWLPRQRWFAGKGRPITGFRPVTAVWLLPCPGGGRGTAPGLLHLLVRARQSDGSAGPDGSAGSDGEGNTGEGRVDGSGSSSGAGSVSDPGDCYQLLLGVREILPPQLAPALVGRPAAGPLRGHVVYEALHDPRLARLLLERLRAPGRLGPLRFVREPGAGIPSDLPARPLATDQSNSSVVYGSAYILKVFRRVEHGVNPDLELPLALSRLGSDRVPAPTAWFEARPPGAGGTGGAGGTLTLGVLQPYLPGCHDGWQLALRALAERREFTAAARSLGRATAEVHTGLAHELAASVLDRRALEQVAADMAARLEAASAAVPALRPYRGRLREAFSAVAELGRRGHVCRAQRVHGDLHLGQVLRDESGHWSLIDFEGEPARPLAQRRTAQPVVRDIAGMLRSFDYAACQQDRGPADPWSQEWAAANRAAFCAGYAAASGDDPRGTGTLLRAYETDKAIYEVLYEARHRPDWLPIPLSAVRRLAAPPHR